MIKISTTESSSQVKEVKAFKTSEEPPYLAIMVKPEPGLWEDLMDQNYLYIIRENNERIFVDVKQRIEIGDSSVFFVTSDKENFKQLSGEFN
jgi:hypothetical protein